MPTILPRALVAAALLFALALPVHAQADADSLVRRAAASRAKGQEGAPVLVLEIADFQCPYCARFAADVFPKLDSAYVRTGKVHWVFVNLPLPGHSRAWAASEAALCAGGSDGRFWEMHDRLFGEQQEWSTAPDPAAVFAGYAADLGLNVEAFERCVRDDLVAQLILGDAIFGAARVNGTPAFLIGGEGARPVVGMKSFEELRQLIEQALAGQP